MGGNIELPPTEQVSFYGYSTGKVRLELNHAALSCLGTGRIALRVLESIMPSGNPIFIHVTGMVGAAFEILLSHLDSRIARVTQRTWAYWRKI